MIPRGFWDNFLDVVGMFLWTFNGYYGLVLGMTSGWIGDGFSMVLVWFWHGFCI